MPSGGISTLCLQRATPSHPPSLHSPFQPPPGLESALHPPSYLTSSRLASPLAQSCLLPPSTSSRSHLRRPSFQGQACSKPHGGTKCHVPWLPSLAISTKLSFSASGLVASHSSLLLERRVLRWRKSSRGGREGDGEVGERRRGGGGPVRALGPGPELGGAVEVIENLGLDALTFLVATVLVIPTFKSIKASPVLGFLLSGVFLSQFGLIRNVTDVKALSELGILFLLFEMGLELSLARLKALAKFAFGIGLPQVLLCTLAFTAFELPTNRAIGTQILEYLFHSRPDLVSIRSVDEAIVIGAALSLSSSAFVLQLLAERGELATKFGSATLGILLLQDIAVVPLLVVLPILETGDFTDESMFPLLLSAGLKSLLGLGLLLLAGRLLLRRFFEVVADSRSPEAFVALCLLTVTGTAMLTQNLGFSDTLGAFLAGALLAETNYRTQVEADIRPFRGLLLGLFFVTTGTSIDFNLFLTEWPNVLALLAGLVAIKTSIVVALGPRAGLSLSESVRTGLLLSQGGEFAFVVFSLANTLDILPIELNRLLIIVVVLSMAITPLLDSFGQRAAAYISKNWEETDWDADESGGGHEHHYGGTEPVVIVGFGQMGQVLGNFLSTPLAGGGDASGWPYVSFDLDPRRVKAARRLGFPVLYGDGSRPAVLQTAGIVLPKAVMVMYTGRERAVQAVDRLRQTWPEVPIYARAQDLNHMLELKGAGATDVVLENAETSLRLGSLLLQDLGVMRDDIVFLRRLMREAMDQRARDAFANRNGEDTQLVDRFQAKVQTVLKERAMDDSDGTLTAEDDYFDDECLVNPVLRFEPDLPPGRGSREGESSVRTRSLPSLAASSSLAREQHEQNERRTETIPAEAQLATGHLERSNEGSNGLGADPNCTPATPSDRESDGSERGSKDGGTSPKASGGGGGHQVVEPDARASSPARLASLVGASGMAGEEIAERATARSTAAVLLDEEVLRNGALFGGREGSTTGESSIVGEERGSNGSAAGSRGGVSNKVEGRPSSAAQGDEEYDTEIDGRGIHYCDLALSSEQIEDYDGTF
eukprot:TRINITY_DN12842_c0_g6_i1.p1 TRINITY_DN12842_c0_g6~~TRINITY_DN12842_c0_g6_i1.p1  ORF type:complete len:1052 (+),score=209.97 TRINITY_DN12842_c0_g6_i1:519-3674(+)